MTLVLSYLSIIFFILVFITRIRNDYWIFKVLEYPRLQKLMLIIGILILWAFHFPLSGLLQHISFGLLCISAGYLCYKIYPYSVLSAKQMKGVTALGKHPTLKILTANVYQDNKEYVRLIAQIKAEDPDMVFLLETNKTWEKALSVLEISYPYILKEPLENTYGLLLYSRFPLEDANIKYLVKEDIPSIEATVILKNEQRVKIWGLHPEPPIPGENLYATAKDKELMKVALKVRDCKLPCLVFGDLNDVAWSHTTELFCKVSNLLDPRIGRGIYATFSAHNFFIRFPLDYIFCSAHFGLISMKRLPKNGSDHFATCTHLALVPALQNIQETPEADKEEMDEAKGKLNKKVEN